MMSNHDIQLCDFDNICRTCLSNEDLHPLYEKYSSSSSTASLSDMLMACTSVKILNCCEFKFSEDDGFPLKICTHCINETNQAFSFAKRCETTDMILRKSVAKIKTELPDNLSPSHIVESTIKVEDIKSEIIHLPTEEVLGNNEFVEKVNQENDVKIEYVEVKEDQVQTDYYGEDKQDNLKIEYDYNKAFDDSAHENYEKDIYSEQSDNPRSTYTNYQKNEESSEEEDGVPSAEKKRKNYQESLKKLDPLNVCQRIHTGDKKDGVGYNVINLKHRMRNRTGKKRYTCEICSKIFAHANLLKIHMRVHTGEKPYTCEVCSKTFSQINVYKYHMLLHTGDKPYTCKICYEVFDQRSLLNKHRRRMHPSEKLNACLVCNKTFTRRERLEAHMRVHTGEKPYTCEFCSKDFRLISTYNYHLRTHTGEKPPTCEICSKTFTRPSDLKVHMSIHTGKKPHICGVCRKPYTRSSLLKVHMRIHTGEKPYPCEVCNKYFSVKSTRDNHMKIHTREKSFVCLICKKGFAQQNTLNKHNLRMHSE